MIKPPTLKQQQQGSVFIPDRVITFAVDIVTYDRVQKPVDPNDPKKGLKQLMDNLPECPKDIEAWREVMHFYDWNKDEDTYMLHDPSHAELIAAFKEVWNKLSKNRDTNFLIFFVFASHGMNSEGKQVILTNDFDKNK